MNSFCNFSAGLLLAAVLAAFPCLSYANDVAAGISGNETVRGAISGAGVDRYMVEVPEGAGFAASVSNVGDCKPGSMLTMDVLDSDNNPQFGGGSTCFYREFMEELPPGKWTLQVKSTDDFVTSPIPYELRLVQVPGAKGTPMKFGKRYSGGIFRGGIDVYSINGTPGVQAQLVLDSDESAGYFHEVTIIAPSGMLMGGSAGKGRIDQDLPMEERGKYTVMVWRSSDNKDEKSAYTIFVKRFDDPDPAAAEVAQAEPPPEGGAAKPETQTAAKPETEAEEEPALNPSRMDLVVLRSRIPVADEMMKTPRRYVSMYQYGLFTTFSPDSYTKEDIETANMGDTVLQLKLGDARHGPEWWPKAAGLGNADAQNRLGMTDEKNAAEGKYKAAAWYRRVVEQGALPPEAEGARKSLRNYKYDQAFAQYRAIAEKGNPAAQFDLAVLYSLGLKRPPDYAEAAKWYGKAAAQGLIVAQNNLGELYEHGQGVKKDDTRAVALYSKAAEAGYPQALYNLGRMAASGRGMKKDTAGAAAWLKQAAAAGQVDAQAELDALQGSQEKALAAWKKTAASGNRVSLRRLIAAYRKHGVPEKDLDDVLALYRQISEETIPEVYAALGDVFAKRSPPDYPEAYFWYKLAAHPVQDFYLPADEKAALLAYVKAQAAGLEKKLSPEQITVAKWRITEWYPAPLTEDEKAALDLFRLGDKAWEDGKLQDALAFMLQASGKGWAKAQLYLGHAYKNGDGVMRNIDKAIAYYKKAFENGSVGAAINIGQLYQYGIGIPQNAAEAVKWYELAASSGDALSINYLGAIYLDGTGEGAKKTIELFEKAAARNLPGAENTLGMIYLYGRGIPADHRKALDWYLKSAGKHNTTGLIQASAILVKYEPHDYARAVKFLREYANPVMLNNLAYMYEHGLGVKKQVPGQDLPTQFSLNMETEAYKVVSMTDPYKLYKVAADMCYGRAMYNVGRLLDERGNSIAGEWMDKAAMLGSAAAIAWVSKSPRGVAREETAYPPKSCKELGWASK